MEAPRFVPSLSRAPIPRSFSTTPQPPAFPVPPPKFPVPPPPKVSQGPEASQTTVVRIRRKGGEVVQGCDVYIGRRCTMGGWKLESSKWANPYTVKEHGRERACQLYREYILATPALREALEELRGKVLGCFCCDEPVREEEVNESNRYKCHGVVLLSLLREAKERRVKE